MNKTIWKYTLEICDMQTVAMPEGAEILSIANQEEQLCLWALADPSKPYKNRTIEIFGTGNPVYCDIGIERTFIGTTLMNQGRLVWHVFEMEN